MAALLVGGQRLRVRQQRERPLVVLRQIAAHHEGRTENAPQVHHGELLIAREIRHAGAAEADADLAQRQHVAVRPAAGAHMRLPHLAAAEHVFKQIPAIPEIVRHAPHVGKLLHVPGFLDHRGAGGKAEHHVAAAGTDGGGDHLNLLRSGVGAILIHVRVADIVHLHEIHAPGGIELEDGVIICLRAGLGTVHAVHVAVPAADGEGVGDLFGRHIRAEHGHMRMHRLAGDAAHDVDAELQAHGMDLIRNRLEALAARAAGEAVFSRDLAAVFIEAKLGEGAVFPFLRAGQRLGPLDVAHNVLPAVLLHVVAHIAGVRHELLFRHIGGKAVPAVPAHGRLLCNGRIFLQQIHFVCTPFSFSVPLLPQNRWKQGKPGKKAGPFP